MSPSHLTNVSYLLNLRCGSATKWGWSWKVPLYRNMSPSHLTNVSYMLNLRFPDSMIVIKAHITKHYVLITLSCFFLAHLFCFLWVDWNSGFVKTSLWKKGWLQKVWQKKTTKGWLCGSHKKDRASHEVGMGGIFGGWGFALRSCP